MAANNFEHKQAMRNFLFTGCILLLVACSTSTKIEKSWTDPSVNPATIKPFEKILFVVLVKDESTRRIAEDRLVKQSGGRGVASYTFLKPGDSKENEKEIAERLRQNGFDGAVVMRLANVEKNATYTPGNSYGGWYSYYWLAYPGYDNTGYYSTDKIYYIETNIYSLDANKLLWSGVTSTINPAKTEKVVDEITTVIKNKLKEEGLMK